MFGYIRKKDALKIIDRMLMTDREIYKNCQSWQHWMLEMHKTEGYEIDKDEFNLKSKTADKYIEASDQLNKIRKQIEDL